MKPFPQSSFSSGECYGTGPFGGGVPIGFFRNQGRFEWVLRYPMIRLLDLRSPTPEVVLHVSFYRVTLYVSGFLRITLVLEVVPELWLSGLGKTVFPTQDDKVTVLIQELSRPVRLWVHDLEDVLSDGLRRLSGLILSINWNLFSFYCIFWEMFGWQCKELKLFN